MPECEEVCRDLQEGPFRKEAGPLRPIVQEAFKELPPWEH